MRAKWAAPQGDVGPERLFKVVFSDTPSQFIEPVIAWGIARGEWNLKGLLSRPFCCR
jgi:hypothetical protein